MAVSEVFKNLDIPDGDIKYNIDMPDGTVYYVSAKSKKDALMQLGDHIGIKVNTINQLEEIKLLKIELQKCQDTTEQLRREIEGYAK